MLYFYKYLVLRGNLLTLNTKLKMVVLLIDVNKAHAYDAFWGLFVYPMSIANGC